MMAAVMVTAATCNQNEKIEKHVTPTSTLPPQQPSPIVATKFQGKINNYPVCFWSNISKFKFPYLFCYSINTDGNGIKRFAEIATQTKNFTNLLSTFNKSLTNCHNSCVEQNNSHPLAENTTISTNYIDNNNKIYNGTMATSSPPSMPPQRPQNLLHQPASIINNNCVAHNVISNGSGGYGGDSGVVDIDTSATIIVESSNATNTITPAPNSTAAAAGDSTAIDLRL